MPPSHSDPALATRWWTPIEKENSDEVDRIECQLCPRECRLKPGDRGFCFVRQNIAGQMALTTYGRSTGFCIDPIEKKPLHHFYPGTPVLSFGTAGCNLGCKFCQNWDISKSRQVERLSAIATPEQIAHVAQQQQCTSVAFTYNDPVIWAEYAIDTATACRQVGVKTVAVTAGYISPQARVLFFAAMDAANVDLKAFTEEFYFKVTLSHLQPVLDTLIYLQHHTDVWFEITNLIIPQANDHRDELRKMCDWILEALGDQVPIHFSAFHPDYRMLDRPRTPQEKLLEAYDIAKQTGLKFPYVGNVHDVAHQSTFCTNCNALLIQRDWYHLGTYALQHNLCSHCKTPLPGHFSAAPGTWGRKRLPIDMDAYPIPISIPNRNSVTTPTASQSSEMNTLEFSAEEQSQILSAASRFVVAAVTGQTLSAQDDAMPPALAQRPTAGVFVTLHRLGALRGCCGSLGAQLPLGKSISESAQRTAVADHRFPPVAPSELEQLDLDVTVLGPRAPVLGPATARDKAIVVGRDGLRIQKGNLSGLLLPQVATEQGWDALQFLAGVCRKAGLPLDAWRDEQTQLEAFPGFAFGNKLQVNPEWLPTQPPLINPIQLKQLSQWASQNVAAVLQGATPTYYATGLPDENVQGIIITMSPNNSAAEPTNATPEVHISRMLLTGSLPLQSTLFQLCGTVAQWIQANRPPATMQLNLSLVDQLHPIPTNDIPENDSATPASTSLTLLTWGDQFFTLYDPNLSPADRLKIAMESPLGQIDSHDSENTSTNTLAAFHARCYSTLPRFIVQRITSTPQQSPLSKYTGVRSLIPVPRPPAVAGKFYAADDVGREVEIDAALLSARNIAAQNLATQSNVSEREKRCYAVLSPHAGLRFSGAVAATLWSQIEIPSSVIIFSPKHTRAGAPWAIAPCSEWQLSSTASLAADPQLAKQMTEAIAGWQLDTAAHQAEHGIELQLPFLHRFAPQCLVTGVAIGLSPWDVDAWTKVDQSARQLADFLQTLPERPLLVISSDMHHFAEDSENRRLDRLALDAFHSGDGERLLATCREYQISMCGAIPAALVLRTLQHLGLGVHINQLAYATSADVSGDLSRVVGYASATVGPSISDRHED